jgi:N-acetyl-anhydromuramyl-L-alanine amidase AmpD
MKKESEAIKRLTDIKSEVSCHYLIKNNGEIVNGSRFIYCLACRYLIGKILNL